MSKSLQKKAPLPSKEASLFKELLSLYETRQLKKGLKTSDQILKKFPEHGETLCMKGLILTNMAGRRDEGVELVKKGVRLDLTSHICWHVFGLVQKADKNYEEALKSYTQALRFDKDNLNLLRDSAQLQTQLRLYDGLVDTRHSILRLRPNHRQNWVALAVAHHLNGNPKESRMVLEHYQRSLKNVPDYDIEHSETLLYYVHVLEEIGDLSEALSVLDTSSKSRSIVDRTSILEIRARLLTKQKAPEAEEAWRSLIQHNPDSYESFRGFFDYLDVSLDIENSKAVDLLEEFATQLPKATAPRRLQLNVASGDRYKELVKAYLVKYLVKGVPSLFADLKSLYSDKIKQQVIEDVVESLCQEYTSTQSTKPTPSDASADPTTYLWTLYYLAQHYSYLSQHPKALSLLDIALKHTPTLPELHMCKARTLKRAGDYLGAARCQNDARLLDGQDRFLNTKFGKYLLRAGMIDEANAIFGLFTKKDAPSPAADLQDMQSLLFLLGEADAYKRNGKLNLSLKKYIAVKKVFDELEDDQFDFHGYNLRKFTLNIYLKLLKWEDQLRSHPAYIKAAIEASAIFVSVFDDPSIVASLASSNKLTDAEKKANKKAKKAAQKVQEDKKTQIPANDKDPELVVPKDDDPDGMKLIASSDALEQASKLLHPLTTLAPDNIDVWIAVYDVAIRRKKLLQAAGALNRAVALDPYHPELHIRLIDVKQRASSLPQTPPAPIGPIFLESIAKLIPDEVSLETFNSQFLQRQSSDPEAILAAAKVMQRLKAPLADIEETLFSLFGPEVRLNIQTSLLALRFISSVQSSREGEFKAQCQTKFPLATVFQPEAELVQLREQVMQGSPFDADLEEATP